MADEHTQRPYRASQPPVRSSPSTASGHASGNDPLAELARLIGQSDPFGEYGRQNAARAGQQPTPQSVPAPAYADERHAPTEADAQDYAAQSYAHRGYAQQHYPHDDHPRAAAPAYVPQDGGYAHSDDPVQGYPPAEDHGFYDDVLPRRHIGILAAAGIFAVAVIGTAGAFGYRAVFGTSGTKVPPVIKADARPTKIVPAAASKDPKSGKLIYDRVGGAQGEKLVSREEQPVEMRENATGATPNQGGATIASVQSAMGTGVVATEPKKIHTIAIRPDGTEIANAAASTPSPPAPAPAAAPPPTNTAPPPRAQAAEPAHQTVAVAELPPRREAPPNNAPLSLSPDAPRPATSAPHRAVRTATVAPPARTAPASPAPSAASGGYAVQIASRHEEAEAQASFHSLQAKYPRQLGGKQPLIRRVDLGTKGVYYRAMVGPFGTSEEAGHLCLSLKAAGGQCIVQRI